MIPSILRSRAATVLLMGVFLIPISLSSLRGLTHVLTCDEEVATPFTVILENGEALVLSSTAIVAGQDPTLCDGLVVDVRASTLGNDQATLDLLVSNTSGFDWRGTVNVALGDQGVIGDVLIPVSIGEVAAGKSVSETLVVSLDEGTHEFGGRLLIGP